MRITNRKSAVFAATLICGWATFVSALASPARSQSTAVAAHGAEAQEIVLVLDPTHCKVQYTVDSSLHTVHGTFNMKSGTVHFDPESGKAGGEIVVYATSGESGNNSRDSRMHKEILESPKYPDVVFRPTQVEGKVTRDGNSDVKLHGVMLLHGKEHELVVPVHAELTAGRWTGTTSFPVPYIDWGLKDPSNWLLKVKPVVNIELEMTGSANSQK